MIYLNSVYTITGDQNAYNINVLWYNHLSVFF